MGALQENALSVQTEKSVNHAEIAEAEAHRFLRRSVLRLKNAGNAVEIRVVGIPEEGGVNIEHEALLRHPCRNLNRVLQRRRGRSGAAFFADGQSNAGVGCGAGRICYRQPCRDISRFRVAGHENVGDCNGFSCAKGDVSEDSAVVYRISALENKALVAVRGVGYRHAVDVFSAGVDHADGKEVFSGFSYAVCHIELKRRFAALIGAETAAVQPHLRHVVHNAEA